MENPEHPQSDAARW